MHRISECLKVAREGVETIGSGSWFQCDTQWGTKELKKAIISVCAKGWYKVKGMLVPVYDLVTLGTTMFGAKLCTRNAV